MKKTISFVLATAIIILLCACGNRTAQQEADAISALGAINEDGTVSFSLFNGKTLQITNDDTAYAQISPDRTKVILLDRFGHLKYADTNGEEKNRISDNVLGVYGLYNDGLIYEVEDNSGICFHAYSFINNSDVVIYSGESAVSFKSFKAAGTELKVAYAKDGHILYYEAAMDTPVEIALCNEIAIIQAMAYDGSSFVWSDLDKEKDTVYIYENDSVSRLLEEESSSRVDTGNNTVFLDSSLLFQYNHAGTYLFIKKSGDNTFYLAQIGGGLHRYTLKYQPMDWFTIEDRFENDDSDTLDGFYVISGAEALYYLGTDGDAVQVVKGMKDYRVYNHKLYYLDEDYTLYSVSLSEGTIEEKAKISDKVMKYGVVGDYLYYAVNNNMRKGLAPSYNSDSASLYVLKEGEKEARKVPLAHSFDSISTDGKTVFFFNDLELEKEGPWRTTRYGRNSYYDYWQDGFSFGTLCSYTYGDKEAKIIDTNVVVHLMDSGSFSSGKQYRISDIIPVFNSHSFTYCKYKRSTDEAYYYSFCYYDGKESTVIEKNAIQYRFD